MKYSVIVQHKHKLHETPHLHVARETRRHVQQRVLAMREPRLAAKAGDERVDNKASPQHRVEGRVNKALHQDEPDNHNYLIKLN